MIICIYTEIIIRLQQVVDDNVILQANTLNEPKEEVYVDLSKLDFADGKFPYIPFMNIMSNVSTPPTALST